MEPEPEEEIPQQEGNDSQAESEQEGSRPGIILLFLQNFNKYLESSLNYLKKLIYQNYRQQSFITIF